MNVEGTAWYLFADPVLCPSVVYGYVGDSEGPTVISETDFSSQAVKVRASIDFGYGAIDHIGAVKNPGAPAS
ncbi:phage major capsid protein [Azospirillum argentinense]